MSDHSGAGDAMVGGGDAEGVLRPPGRPEVEAAARRIAGHVRTTPVLPLDAGLVLKLEMLQHTGSFKPRGAFNWLLGVDVPPAGVVAASGGNFAAAMAYATRELGIPATIVVPEVTSPVKRARLAELGAQVEVVPEVYADALATSRKLAAESGALLAHAYDDAHVVAGQGTCGRELDQQVGGAVDTVLVAVGGGGLIAGIAAWFPESVRIVGVEPERIPALHAAVAAGHPVDVEVSGLAADSLGASRIGEVPWAVVGGRVEQVALVADDAIAAAQRDLWSRCRVVAEPGGAAAWAALTSGAYRPEPGERVSVVVCGANVDLATIA